MAALAATACGDDGTPAGGGDDRLVVTRFDGERPLERRELDCAGADEGLCARIAGLLPALRPDPDEVCTEIYGGPERITLRGRLDGRDVALELTRTNGCEIARYDRLVAVL